MGGFRHAHPGSPYVFGLVEDNHDLEFPDPMPVVGKSLVDPFSHLLLEIQLSFKDEIKCQCSIKYMK